MVSIRLVRPRGLTSYAQGLLLQAEALRRVRQGKGDTLIVLEHEPVYTAGRRSASQINSGRLAHTTMAGDQLLPAPVVATDRGGQVTFHGPGQLVLYPILDLRRFQVSKTGSLRIRPQGPPNQTYLFHVPARSKV